MIARTVTVRAKTRHRFGDQTVLVFQSGQMMVRECTGGALVYVDAVRAGLSNGARQKAWQLSGFRRGEK